MKIVGWTILILYFTILWVSFLAVAEAKPSGVVVIDAHNPYRMTVKIELKCDWSHKKQKFYFKENYIIKPKSTVRMFIPSTVKKCQIWPKVNLF